ncbi:MAG TPA: hypothetical protein VFL62_22835 [Bradyrhizobium sp.]|uniref:hypothetical protein n=1 Tax=Bradyrhizobium sp. TaxID=376 RepID=UPI002D802653|nr:hypothetical protein [Bradyrhizobium sp.]HET7889074.1 hypothetical protein [Bradyrhizobium sp.]
MQRELPTIDFRGEAEVRAKAESRRTQDVSELVKALFAWWTPKMHRSGRPILGAVQQAHRAVTAGRS